MMNKGDRTEHGIYLGEVIARRPQQISTEDAQKSFEAIEAARDVSLVKDPANPANDFTTPEEAHEGAIEFLRTRVVCYQFETDDGEKLLLPVERGAPDVLDPAPPPPGPEPIPDAPQPELGRFIEA